MNQKNYINSVFLLFAAFTMTNAPLLEYLEASGQLGLASSLSSQCLMLTTIGSMLIVVKEKVSWQPIVLVAIIMYVIVFYERKVDYFGTVKEYSNVFLIHGLGGFLMGYAINDYKKFIIYLFSFSVLYAIIFFFEPINHNLIGRGGMATGYTLIGTIINLILAYFTFYRNKFVLMLALASTFIIVIFTSRGCGIAVMLTWVSLYLWDQKRKGIKLKRKTIKFFLLGLVAYLALMYGIDYVNSSHMDVSTGSLAEKIASGYADSSNGRDELWEEGIGMIRSSWLTGMGFGADRAGVVGFYVHNIFIELCIDFGIPLTILILYGYWSTAIKGFRCNYYSLASLLIIVQVFKTWVQLLFSSSYLRAMVGLMIIIGISARAIINNRKSITVKNNSMLK